MKKINQKYLFSFPTGVGALLVSKRGQKVLKKHYYGGGTVKISMTRQEHYRFCQ